MRKGEDEGAFNPGEYSAISKPLPPAFCMEKRNALR
jgi:hypothetical protein